MVNAKKGRRGIFFALLSARENNLSFEINSFHELPSNEKEID